jgi:hypothetical protein
MSWLLLARIVEPHAVVAVPSFAPDYEKQAVDQALGWVVFEVAAGRDHLVTTAAK